MNQTYLLYTTQEISHSRCQDFEGIHAPFVHTKHTISHINLQHGHFPVQHICTSVSLME